MEYSILIIVTPFILFLVLGLVGSKFKPSLAGIIGTMGMALCTILAYLVAYQYFFQTGKTDGQWQTIIPFRVIFLPAAAQTLNAH